MAEAPVLSTKNNNNNISPQPWELGLSQRQSGGGEVLVLVLALAGLVLLLALALAFGRYNDTARVRALLCRGRAPAADKSEYTWRMHRPASREVCFRWCCLRPLSLHADRCWLSSEGASPEFTQRPHNNISAQICL